MKWRRIRWRKRGERENVLGRGFRLLPLVRGWSWPESEPVPRVVWLWWASLILWVHSSRPCAGFRRDHVGIGIGFLVEEDALHHRRCPAGCGCVSAARAALHQVSAVACCLCWCQIIFEMTYCCCLQFFTTHALYIWTSLGKDVNIGPLGNDSEVLVFFLSSRVRWAV